MPAVELISRLRVARDLIDRRFSEPLDLDALAEAAGYSRHYFAHGFREVFGESPGAYLSRRRIERAMDLLRHANLTVTEVCMLVGFTSLGSFSSRFRRLNGCSPSRYRERVRRGGDPAVPGCFVLAWARPGDSASQEKPGASSRT